VGKNSWNLNLNDRHDIAATDQARSGAKIECVNCHDPHAANNTNRLIADPDPTDGRTPGSAYVAGANTQTDWCLDCHDNDTNTYPPPVTGPTNALIDILTTLAGDAHGLGDGNAQLDPGYGYVDNMTVQCFNCHTRHMSGSTPSGVTNYFHLKVIVKSTDGLTDIPDDNSTFNYETSDNLGSAPDSTSGYDWCNTCHQSSMNNSNCFRCHYHGTRW
jgi:hypothetical protein